MNHLILLIKELFMAVNFLQKATYDNSVIRYCFIRKIIEFSSYNIIPKHHSFMGCYCNDPSKFQESMYYEWIYDVQDVPKNFMHQLIFCALVIRDAFELRRKYIINPRKAKDNNSELSKVSF